MRNRAWASAFGAVLAAALAPWAAKAQTLDPSFSDPNAWVTPWRLTSPSPSFGGPAPSAGWRGLIWPPMAGGAIDRFDLEAGGGLHGENGQPLLVGRFGDQGLIARLTSGGRLGRDWPSAVRIKTAGGFGFDVTPHAGLGLSGAGDSHEAGALVRFGRGLGLADGEPGRRGRWFLFASSNHETLGLNFLHNEDAWKRVGLGPDPGATIGDTRAGLGFSDGPFEASVGYLFREIKPRDWDMIGAQSNRESLVAFRIAVHPGWRR
jgi:hypothetical protein